MNTFGNLESLPDGEFSRFDGFHKDRSSRVDLLPTTAIVRKDKSGRKPEKTLHEFIALHAWNKLTQAHQNQEIRIHSPEPIALDELGRIYMTYVQGFTGGQIVSQELPRETFPNKDKKNEVKRGFLVRLGRLLAMKELEGVIHGDFQLRHVLFDTRTSLLGVIDVENSRLGSFSEVERENKAMEEVVRASFPKKPFLLKMYSDAIDEGRSSLEGADPKMTLIAEEIRKELGVPLLNF